MDCVFSVSNKGMHSGFYSCRVHSSVACAEDPPRHTQLLVVLLVPYIGPSAQRGLSVLLTRYAASSCLAKAF